jgi:hypothetical protein
MKKNVLTLAIFILSFSVVEIANADPFVPGLNSPTGVAGQGTAIPASTPAPTPTAAPASPSSPASPAAATQTAPTTAGSAGYYQVKLQEPLSGQSAYVSASNGVDLINQYISMIYMWMASIVGIIAVLMLVISGIQIIFGGASPELVSDAKNRVFQSLLSLVLLFATAMILRTVNPNFFGFA